jgi:hypothetical protein
MIESDRLKSLLVNDMASRARSTMHAMHIAHAKQAIQVHPRAIKQSQCRQRQYGKPSQHTMCAMNTPLQTTTPKAFNFNTQKSQVDPTRQL